MMIECGAPNFPRPEQEKTTWIAAPGNRLNESPPLPRAGQQSLRREAGAPLELFKLDSGLTQGAMCVVERACVLELDTCGVGASPLANTLSLAYELTECANLLA